MHYIAISSMVHLRHPCFQSSRNLLIDSIFQLLEIVYFYCFNLNLLNVEKDIHYIQRCLRATKTRILSRPHIKLVPLPTLLKTFLSTYRESTDNPLYLVLCKITKLHKF